MQEGREKKKKPRHNRPHPLAGKLVCGCCKKNLNYRRGLNPYFTCYQRYSDTMENCVQRVNAMFAEQYVLLMMQDKLETEGGRTEGKKWQAWGSGGKVFRDRTWQGKVSQGVFCGTA